MSKLYYKGETILLYGKFISNGLQIKEAKVRILHEHMDSIYEDLPWTNLDKLTDCEYVSKYTIPYDADNGIYNIFYSGIIGDKSVEYIEQFHVADKSQQFLNAIKVYGYLNSSYDQKLLGDVMIQITSEDGIYYTQTSSLFDGYWETFLYPNKYNIIFKLDNFEDYETNFELGFDSREVNFGNVVLESKEKQICGYGMYEISDSYILKNGIPLDGLLVEAFEITNLKKCIAKDITNNNGEWRIFLDPGFYLLRVTGNSMNMNFDKAFRLKVEHDSKFKLDDMEHNVLIEKQEYLSNGEGSIDYEDYILDKYKRPISDVQVNIFKNNKLLAECYTDDNGRYIFHLDPGKYTVELYHPKYTELPKFSINLK